MSWRTMPELLTFRIERAVRRRAVNDVNATLVHVGIHVSAYVVLMTMTQWSD